MEFRVGVRGQESVHRRQELEFRVGVGEWWWRSFMNFFNAETQRRRVAEGQRVLGSRSFRVRGCTKNLTPMVGKRGSATASPLLRAFQPINI